MHSSTRSHHLLFRMGWSPSGVALTLVLTLLFLIFLLILMTLIAPPAEGAYSASGNFTAEQAIAAVRMASVPARTL